jgi:hypothetical protein
MRSNGTADQTAETGHEDDGTVGHGLRLSHELNYRP